ncbi:MAG: VWA domain-containing protein [Saprospiraceae bacterium]|nr:VWA domain-containing protein [Saprospiraceae bacterium]
MATIIFNISFFNPWVLVLIPFLVWIWYKYIFKKTPDIDTDALRWNAPEVKKEISLKERVFPWLKWLPLLGLVSIIVALARPIKLYQEEKIKADGIDIVLAMDLSSSMLSRDFEPDRLSVAKEMARDFVSKRIYDRIGLVVFAGESFTQCPVTTNHEIVKGFLSTLQTGVLEDGTAIGMGLATASNRLKDSKSASKIIILMTDGVNNAGYIDPTTAIDMAKSMGLKVYTIGIGSTGVAISPVSKDAYGDYIFGPTQVDIDEELLNKIASETNGKYYRAKNREELGAIYNEIDRLEKTELEVNVFRRQSEFFRPFVIFGLSLLVVYFLLLFVWIKKYL